MPTKSCDEPPAPGHSPLRLKVRVLLNSSKSAKKHLFNFLCPIQTPDPDRGNRSMRIGSDEDFIDTIDIPSPPRGCIVMTTQQNVNPGLASLTDGQRDCLRYVYSHMTSKDIARILQVSPHTVDMRLRTAMKALAVGSRIEAARLLVQAEAGGGMGRDSYQSLIYHCRDGRNGKIGDAGFKRWRRNCQPTVQQD